MTLFSPLATAALAVVSLLQAAPQTTAPQTPAPPAEATGIATPLPPAPGPVKRVTRPTLVDVDPALWVVKDEDTTIYLFGTIHVLKPGLSWFDEAVKTAFDKSTELRLEMLMPDFAASRAVAVKAATLPEGQTLTSKLPPETQAKLAAALTSYGLPATAYDRFTPWFAANNLSILPLMKLGYKLEAGAEQVLTGAAKSDGKTISGFETFEEQLGFFSALSDKAQVDFLTSMIDDLPRMAATVDAMVADWGRGDPAALAKLLNDDLDKNRELAEVLLYQRNAKWADWIKTRMDQPGTVFVAVGAGHLAGEQSVQDLLAKRGLKAERVPY